MSQGQALTVYSGPSAPLGLTGVGQLLLFFLPFLFFFFFKTGFLNLTPPKKKKKATSTFFTKCSTHLAGALHRFILLDKIHQSIRTVNQHVCCKFKKCQLFPHNTLIRSNWLKKTRTRSFCHGGKINNSNNNNDQPTLDSLIDDTQRKNKDKSPALDIV